MGTSPNSDPPAVPSCFGSPRLTLDIPFLPARRNQLGAFRPPVKNEPLPSPLHVLSHPMTPSTIIMILPAATAAATATAIVTGTTRGKEKQKYKISI